LAGAQDLYEREIGVSFHARLREDMVFDSPAQLARQIAVDVGMTREVLRGLSPVHTRVSLR
jgi:FAD synthase